MALFLLASAIAAAISQAVVPALKDPHLIWPFVGTAVAGFVLAAVFYLMYRYVDQEEFLREGSENHRVSERE